MKKIFISFWIVLLVLPSFSQKKEEATHKDLVEWMTLTEALEKSKTEPRKIFVDIYTDWCGWCKVMSKNTFSNPQIAGYINRYFYPVRFNAETHDTILFRDKKYYNPKPKGQKGTHQLTYVLTNNKPSYPTISYLDETGKLIQALPGYMDVNKIEPFLIYFNENAFRSAPFEAFKYNFDLTFVDSVKNKKDKIKWLTFEAVDSLSKTKPKPILIDIYTSWSLTSKIMEATTFKNDLIADYINQHYYAIHFDPTTQDTIVWGGRTYYHRKELIFHDLSLLLANKKLGIPAMIFLSKEKAPLSNVPGYRTAAGIDPVLEYFAKEIYKVKRWNDFYKTFKARLNDKVKK